MKTRYAILCLWCVACNGRQEAEPIDVSPVSVTVSVEKLVNVTPPTDAQADVRLNGLETKLQQALSRDSQRQQPPQACGQAYVVKIEPQVLFGFEPDSKRTIPLSEWSGIISVTDRFNGTTSRVELFWLAQASRQNTPIDQHLAESLDAFVSHVNDALHVLSADQATLEKILLNGAVGQQKLLLERLSSCPIPMLDRHLGTALKVASDQGIRFRLVGLIGERRVSELGDLLIDLIDLNDVEWTRVIVRTLSTLEHRRTQELLDILSVHESPILQKEIKGASDRLERQRKIP